MKVKISAANFLDEHFHKMFVLNMQTQDGRQFSATALTDGDGWLESEQAREMMIAILDREHQ